MIATCFRDDVAMSIERMMLATFTRDNAMLFIDGITPSTFFRGDVAMSIERMSIGFALQEDFVI